MISLDTPAIFAFRGTLGVSNEMNILFDYNTVFCYLPMFQILKI